MKSPEDRIDWKELIIGEAVRAFSGPGGGDQIGISTIMDAVERRHAMNPDRKHKTGKLDRSFAYAFFGNIHVLKAHVAARAWAELARSLMSEWSNSLLTPRKADDTLVRLCVAYVAFAQENPSRFRLMFDPHVWALCRRTGLPQLRTLGPECFTTEIWKRIQKSDVLDQKLVRDLERFWQPDELIEQRDRCWQLFAHTSARFGTPKLTQFFASYAQGRAHEAVHEGAGFSPEQKAEFRTKTESMLRVVLEALSQSTGGHDQAPVQDSTRWDH